jgi:hypothetical protein
MAGQRYHDLIDTRAEQDVDLSRVLMREQDFFTDPRQELCQYEATPPPLPRALPRPVI